MPPPTNATLKPGACVVVGTYFTIDASGFAPNEEINFYLTVDGENIQLDPIQADAQGRVELFDQALAHVLEMEGGFSDDAYDPGGPTNYGITLAVYAAGAVRGRLAPRRHDRENWSQ